MIAKRQFAGALMATGLLTSGLFAASSVTTPGTAEARCNGRGNEITSEFWTGGVRRAYETPRDGTCNGNNAYDAYLVDPVTDGACATVQFADGGQGWTSVATACTTGARVPFIWRDRNGDSTAKERFCAEEYGCGWGRGEAAGANHGY